MRNSVFLSRRTEKFLGALRDAKLYARLRAAIDRLAQNARPSDCVKLAGEPDLYRIRVGDYRIIYQVNDRKLTVLDSLATGMAKRTAQKRKDRRDSGLRQEDSIFSSRERKRDACAT